MILFSKPLGIIKFFALALLAWFVLGFFASCLPNGRDQHVVCGDPGGLEVIGTWRLNEGALIPRNRVTITITDSSFVVSDDGGNVRFSAGVVRYKNDTFNGGETHGSNHGYVMVKFYDGSLLSSTPIPPEAIGEYGVIRWKNLDKLSNGRSKVDFLIAYKDMLLASHTSNAETAYYDFTKREGHFAGLTKYMFLGSVRDQ